jgi:cytochrome c peroxidase
MPCFDKTNWMKMNGPNIETSIYEKKIGRPPKSRRKQPHEIQGKNGPSLSRHGIIIHCSWCHKPNHNSKGCSLKKAGIRPKQVRRHPTSFTATIGDEEEENATYTQQGTKEVMPEQHLQPIVQPLEVQETMLSQMLA